MDKNNVPYYQVAREALIKWNGLKEEQADKMIEEYNFEEIEGQIGAKGSMQYAIDSIAKQMKLNEEEKAELSNAVFGELTNGNTVSVLKEKLNQDGYDINNFIANVMEDVHNGWIKDNQSVFFTKKQDRGQQYQYLPIELIGWNEAKSDLLFIKPIIELIGGEVNEETLKKELNDRTENYVQETIKTASDFGLNFEDIGNDIIDHASRNPNDLFLGTSPWNEEIKEAFADENFVQSIIVPQLREKGLGSDEELMNRMATTPNLESSYNYEGRKKFEPIFWDGKWAEMYGYGPVTNIVVHMEDMDEAELQEEISALDGNQKMELTKIINKLQGLERSANRGKLSEYDELEELKAQMAELKNEERQIKREEGELLDAKESQGPSFDD